MLTNYDLRFLGLFIGALVLFAAVAASGEDPRLASALVGGLAAGLLMWRYLATWHLAPVLIHALAGVLVVILALGAVGQIELANRGGVAPTSVSLPIFGTRLACLVMAIEWPRWLDRRHSPFRKYPSSRSTR